MARLYFDVYETDTHYVYNCSIDKKDILDRNGYSRRIRKNSPEAGRAVLSWFDECAYFDSVRVRTNPEPRLPD